MIGDQTEQQSLGEQLQAEELSRRPTAPPAVLPGYRLDRFLGAGTFGQVWFGHDLNTGRPVAVKFYLHRGGVNWSLLSREVKNLVQLSAERSIVQVLDVGWDAEPPFYVMEFLPNGSLEDLLQATGRLPVSQSVDIFRKICVGLNHCHGRGVLHCDLKPGNILLDSDNSPRLADFGQSRMSHDQSPSLGTLFYMAPEQANLDAAPDARWDVYALGVILYRMLTGKIPHRDESLLGRIDTAGSLPKRLEHYRTAIVNDVRPIAHRGRRGVDRSLAAIVDRCLAPDPAQRFANVQQVLAALDQRDQARARRPLMLLGIVGPLLLMLFSGGFAAYSILETSSRATEALRTEARASNQMAARFAARSLENELQSYFHVLAREAADGATRAVFRDLLASDEMTQMRQRIIDAPAEAAGDRENFLRHADRLPLDAQLSLRLTDYLDDPDNLLPDISTMFITDAQGTIVAIAFDTDVEEAQLSTGMNFAFRTYFHGERNELPRDTPPRSITPLTGPHVSRAFQSTATGLWKLAFSMPIYLTPERAAGDPETELRPPDGVFVITTNLGDFESTSDGKLSDQLAVVVDVREGPLRGTVLQHPLMDRHADSVSPLGEEHFQVEPRVLDELLAGGDVDYHDPMAAAPGGELFAGKWLAAVAPVSLPREIVGPNGRFTPSGSFSSVVPLDATRTGTDGTPTTTEDDRVAAKDRSTVPTTELLVLVQYRLSKVFAPVGELKRRLLVDGAVTLAIIFILTVAMWRYVNRINDPTRFDDALPPIDPGNEPTITVR